MKARRVVPLLFLLFLFSPILAAHVDEDKEVSREARAEWQGALSFYAKHRQSRNHRERAAAADKLGKALIHGAHRHAARLLVSLLAAELDRGKKKEFKTHPKVIEAIVASLGLLSEPGALDWLLGIVQKETVPWRLRLHVIEALGFRDNPRVITVLREAASASDPRIRVIAVDTLGKMMIPDMVDVFLRALWDIQWPVRVAAVQALRTIPITDEHKKDRVVANLIKALKDAEAEKGRLQWEILDALKTLTGAHPGNDAASWEVWAQSGKPAREGKKKDQGMTRAVVPTYHGLKIKSARIVFVLDTTGSMQEPATVTREPGKKSPPIPLPPVITGGGGGGRAAGERVTPAQAERLRKLKKENEDRIIATKMDAEKQELICAIIHLPSHVHFTLVFYAEVPRVWRPLLVPATVVNKIEAVERIEMITPGGGTDIFRALQEAFQIYQTAGGRKGGRPAGGRGRAKVTGGGKKPINRIDAPVDEIFLLSDGRPTVGNILETSRLRAEVRKLNKVRKIRINTIVVGTEGRGLNAADIEFMRRLAEENSGKFIHVK
jgi:Mg-chelatase subunit ChlD